MLERGWFTIPLGMDANNLPKKPLPLEWTSLPPTIETIETLPWDKATGIGIVLGAVSSNLAVLDIDDQELFNIVVIMQGAYDGPRMVRTARNRGHYYFYEVEGPSSSTWREVRFRDRNVKIELKAGGTQVAAPPSPGYTLLQRSPPQPIQDIQTAFEYLLACFDDFIPGQVELVQQASAQGGGSAGYPRPWAPEVPEDVRNKTAYIEAHRLREAGTPLEQALAIMSARFSVAYSKGGIAWYEIQQTVKSAYRKGLPKEKGGYGGVIV